ncbi:TPA: hypothetical protein RTG57_001774 [Campylobacter jejuni]|nr:hypothetical protein [Campylobacter jejuni]HDZ5057844.1 hypothetical protein [Campylobacter jejuni]
MSKNIYIILKAKNYLTTTVNKDEVIKVIKELQSIPKNSFEGSAVGSLIKELKKKYNF